MVGVEDQPTSKSVSSWVIKLDGLLISAGAPTQSVIAQSSCESEYIEATAATSEAKYIQALFVACRQHMNIQLRTDSTGAIGVARRRGLQRLRHLDVRFQLLQAESDAKRVRSSKVPGSEYVVDADTTLADRRSLEFCRMNLGVTQIPRDTVQVLLRLLFLCHAHTRASAIMSCPSCLWELFTVLYVAAATKFCSNVMNHDSDSENVRRL